MADSARIFLTSTTSCLMARREKAASLAKGRRAAKRINPRDQLPPEDLTSICDRHYCAVFLPTSATFFLPNRSDSCGCQSALRYYWRGTSQHRLHALRRSRVERPVGGNASRRPCL